MRAFGTVFAAYADMQELTPEVLQSTIERIEIGHFTRKTHPGQGITIFWKLT